MEFFNQAIITTSVQQLQQHIRIDNLTQWCALITSVNSATAEKGEIYCIWGEFRVHREILRDGIRFSLPGCPNALQWTVTTTNPGTVTLHCTLNKQKVDQDFSDSIVEFLDAWKAGLENWQEIVPVKTPPPDTCSDLYGGFG